MRGDGAINRRIFIGGALTASLAGQDVGAQGFAGLGLDAQGFASVVPGMKLEFPRDHAAHSDYRIEWWYLTANLHDVSGEQYGAQWTLFRQSTVPRKDEAGWDNRQIWMGHAAVTRARNHYFAERFARGGIGQAGVEINPFRAWIDSWEMRAESSFVAETISPILVSATGADFAFKLDLSTTRPLVLQGDAGYSRKSEQGQASYYFSQPYFSANGTLTMAERTIAVTGQAWMDREWSSQPLASGQTGWDWLSLHLESGEKVMLFRLRQTDGRNYFAGNWIARDGSSSQLAFDAISMTPSIFTEVAGRKVPTSWHVSVAARDLNIECNPLNAQSWMGTRFAYWEGPIDFSGSHRGVGYLEMTGY